MTKLTPEQQSRISNSHVLGEKVADIMRKAVKNIIKEVTNQDEDIEKSFDYILSGLTQTFHYQKENRKKWNMGIQSKLKNLDRMPETDLNKVDMLKELDKKISNMIVINFVNPIINSLSEEYYNHTKSTWVSFSKDTGDANSSVVKKKTFDKDMSDYILNLEKTLETRV